MANRTVEVHFDRKCGRVKPINSINGGPRTGGFGLPYDFSDEFSQMGVRVVRTSGSAGEYGLNQFVNVHCIFPDFDADETLPESYNFLPTDLYLQSIKDCGAEIFFRLGESTEPYSRKLYIKAPKDMQKWARICEHIIMHYNEGWADGFKLGLRFFEIWSAADTPVGFVGECEEYFELYRITANHLRERFPKIKIGGYGSRGFSALNRLDSNEEMKRSISFMQKFFAYITAEGTEAPLDFFTWCCYTSNPDEILMHARYARSYLDSAGLRRTRSIICEYNTEYRGGKVPALCESYPSELASALILAQKSSADMMMYSTSDIFSPENALFTMDDHTSPHRYCAFQVMRAFSRLYRLGFAVESSDDYRKELYTLAATSDTEGGVMIAVRNYEGKVEMSLRGADFDSGILTKIVQDGSRGAGRVLRSNPISISDEKLNIQVKPSEVYVVYLTRKQP